MKECNAIIVEIHFFILPPSSTRSRALLFAAIADTWNWINLINTSWLQDDDDDVDDEAEALHAAAVDCVGVDTSHSKSISSLLVMRSFSVPLSHCRVSFLHWKLKLDSGELSELNVECRALIVKRDGSVMRIFIFSGVKLPLAFVCFVSFLYHFRL